MGTPEFAVTILKEILEAGFNVVGVITAPDKPAGRGRKLNESAVKVFAASKGLRVLQPQNLKSLDFIADLKDLQPNVQVVVAFRMLPKVVWKLPEYGTFNLHASLLPDYRGAAPINWAIINGERTTGVSTFFIDEKIDTGEMILTKEVEVEPQENVGQLHDKLMIAGAHLVTQTLEMIKNNNVSSRKQVETGKLKEAPKLTKENTKIEWNLSLNEIYNKIRGLNPYPAAWSNLINGSETLTVKIFEVEKLREDHKLEPGLLIVDSKTIKVAVDGGFIKLVEIQLPGKRKMKVSDLLNGYHFENNSKVL